MQPQTVICLMGPTASGKTEIAMRLADELPVELVSVDSALVYRGLDIGTAKPDAATLERVPHRLVDIRDPEDAYSAGAFVRDARQAIAEIGAAGRLPLLVGGTMMYFRALTQGIAALPDADPALRRELDREAAERGWPALHRDLDAIDSAAAARINPNDRQRIQRALEVYRLSGRPLSDWQADTAPSGSLAFRRVALLPASRQALHERIAQRLGEMMDGGFLDEVRRLRQRPGLTAASPSMRSVGYRQLWAHLDGKIDLDEATRRSLYATRQLAKRQITWLRAETGLFVADPLEARVFGTILRHLRNKSGR